LYSLLLLCSPLKTTKRLKFPFSPFRYMASITGQFPYYQLWKSPILHENTF
jgi:hypothetical protein